MVSQLLFVASCDNKALRDEIVFTRSSRPVIAPGAPVNPIPGNGSPSDEDSPVPRTVEDLLNPQPDVDDDATVGGDDEPEPEGETGPSEVPGSGGKAGTIDTNGGSPAEGPSTVVEPSSEPEPTDSVEPGPITEPEPVDDDEPPPEFTKQRLLSAIAECSSERFGTFISQAQALRDAAAAHAQTRSDATRQAAQTAWLNAILAWEVLELFQFGPAAPTTEPGGLGLRERIYAWNGNPPGSHRCRIETEIVEQNYQTGNFSTVVVRTLSAIEYLIFYRGTDTSCTQFDAIVADGSFAALSPDELDQRKADYAAVAAEQVLIAANALADAWRPGGSGFGDVLSSAGSGNDVFGSQQAALNAVSNAMFYVDKQLKDFKLAMPLGLVPECPRASCPEAFESQYARVSTLLLYQNLIGFEALYAGCDAAGVGFDDWLVAIGAQDLAERMQAALDLAQDRVATLNPPLEDALSSEPEKVLSIHAGVKGVTDLLKTEFVTVLNLELPKTSEGDND